MAKRMISLVVSENQKKTKHDFRSSKISIGSERSSDSSIFLTNPILNPSHVQIIEQDGKYLVINQANDPYVLLNDLPFGKRFIKVGDRLKIHEAEIVIEAITKEITPAQIKNSYSKSQELSNIVEKKIKAQGQGFSYSPSPYPQESPEELKQIFEKEFEETKDRLELSREDIAALVDEVEQLEKEDIETPPEDNLEFNRIYSIKELQENAASSFKETDTIQENGAKPAYHIHYPPLSKLEKPSLIARTIQLYQDGFFLNWKILAWIFAILLLILGTAVTITFLKFSEKSEELEHRAGRSVSDTAMALLHAHLHQAKPQNQNWTDREFLKENLLSILSSRYSSLCELDSQGKLINCPYLLRIYTSKDLSRFLLVAQPAPSLSSWLTPRKAIVLDSEEMQLRKIKDIRALNRLLLTTTTLDGINAIEISDLIQQGEVIPLSILGQDKAFREFNPPQELAFVQPGAESLVYNAPRYYKLTEPVMELASSIAQEDTTEGFETLLFLESLKRLSLLPHLVFYTTKGMESALQAYNGLSQHAHVEGYLIGYLAFDPKNRKIANSHLLMSKSKFQNLDSEKNDNIALSVGYLPPQEAKEETQASSTVSQGDQRIYSIWFNQITDLATSRRQALEPISEKMIDLIQQHNLHVVNDFKERFHYLLFQYEQTDLQAQSKISKTLNNIYKDYSFQNPEASPRVFLSYIKAAGLEPSIENTLRIQLSSDESNP